MAAAISTLAVSLFYLLAQMAGAGGLVTLLLGVSGEAAQAVVVTIVGALMIFYVLVGGMRGTTYVQIIKASLLIVGAFVMTVWVLGKYGFNLSALLGGAQENGRRGRDVLAPGAQYGLTDTSKLDFVSPRPGAGAGDGGPAARADALLHRADGEGRPSLGRLGDLADRHLLPVQPGHRLRRRRPGGRRGDPRRAGCGQRRGSAAGLRTRRHRAAGHHRRRRVRDDPRGRRRA